MIEKQHEFVILRDGVLETYHKYEDIPESFDNLIKFLPYVPESSCDTGHDKPLEEYDFVESWNDRLKNLLKREKPRNNASGN